jgi:hypothetical protein
VVGTCEGNAEGEADGRLLRLGFKEDVGPEDGTLLKLSLLEGDEEG